jgi:hypothetical protein
MMALRCAAGGKCTMAARKLLTVAACPHRSSAVLGKMKWYLEGFPSDSDFYGLRSVAVPLVRAHSKRRGRLDKEGSSRARGNYSATSVHMRTPNSSFAALSCVIVSLMMQGARRPYQARHARAYIEAASRSVTCMRACTDCDWRLPATSFPRLVHRAL